MLWYIDYFNILRINKHMRKVKSNKMKNKIKVHGKVGLAYTARDDNLCPTHRYLAWPDPNGLGFTQPDKE